MSVNNTPQISVNIQYIKDFSFENPGYDSLIERSLGRDKPPSVNVNLEIHINGISQGIYEVVLSVNATVSMADKKLFIVELAYAGVFTLVNIEPQHHRFVLSVHCANMLFPYVRRILSDVTSDAGYQPLLIDPIDFGHLYEQKLKEEEKK